MRVELDRASQAELDRSLKKLADASGKAVKEVFPAQMRLLAADLAFNTRPIGKSAGDQKAGQEKVAKRIGAVYKPVGTAFDWMKRKSVSISRAFSRLVSQKKYTEAAELLNKHTAASTRYTVGMFDGGALHQKQQFSKRVTECLIVVDFKKVEAYSKKIQKLVGFAKGGFATAARELGGVRGIPGFATRQNSPGRGSITESANGISVSIENNVRYIDKALDKAGEERALQSRKRSIDAVLQRMATRRMKQVSKVLK